MLGAGDSTIRRVEPSPPAVDRYGRAGSQTSNASDDTDDEEPRSDADQQNEHKRPHPPAESDDPGPALLSNRPVLRWLRTAPNARMRLSPSNVGALTKPERRAACRELAAYLDATPKTAIAQRLEQSLPSRGPASPPQYGSSSPSDSLPTQSDIDLMG